MPGKRHIHSAKFDRCVKEVSAKGGGYNPYAVCESSIGYKGSILPQHMKGKKIHGMPLKAIEKMVKSKKTPKRLKAFWIKQMKRVM
jgi:hypothetical protein